MNQTMNNDIEDAKLVEWYCAKCFERWVEKEPDPDIRAELKNQT